MGRLRVGFFKSRKHERGRKQCVIPWDLRLGLKCRLQRALQLGSGNRRPHDMLPQCRAERDSRKASVQIPTKPGD